MSKTVKSGKSKTKLVQDPVNTLFAMGYVDLIFKIKFTDKDLLKTESNSNKTEENKEQEKDKEKSDSYYHIEDLNTLADLDFLKDRKYLWDKITISGGNDTLKQLLVGNKIAKKKCNVEYFGFNMLKFQEKEETFKEIFKYLCNKNHLIINETPLEESARYTIKVILCHKGKINTISLGTSYEDEEKERIKKKRRKQKLKEQKEKENNNSNNDNEKSDKEEENKNKKKENKEEEEEESSDDEDDSEEEENQKEDDYEETEAMKEKKIPKFKRSTSILVKLNPKCDKFSMAYINYPDMKRVPGDFKMRDLLELLKFFKSKGTLLFVNFYKPKKPKIEVEEEEIDSHENDNEIMAEGKTKEANNEEPEEEEVEEEKKEKKERTGPSRKMIELNQLYDFTNIYFFDTKQCKKIFNKHYETFTEDNINNRKKITRAKIFDYFIKGIAPATKDEVTGLKTGLFIDQLNKLNIIYASKKAANTQEFDTQPYPKINHNNMKLIEKYKEILSTQKNEYYSILISSIIIYCSAYAPNCQSTNVIYPGFIISLEVIKKKLECEKNDLSPDDSIYKVKLDEKVILKNLEIFASGGKENGFVLDCINKQKSTMKDYVSLYDYHLKTFFSSEMIRKNLQTKGFINSEGFIMYDPIYRDVMREKNKKKKKKITDEEMKAKVMNSINGINVPSNIKDKEIDAKRLAEGQILPTESKLPMDKELITLQSTLFKKKKKKGKKNRGSSHGGSSDESDSGNNSGTVSGGEDNNNSQE